MPQADSEGTDHQSTWHNTFIAESVVPKTQPFELPPSTEELLMLGRVAESVERYDEVAQCVRKLIMHSSTTNTNTSSNMIGLEERNLFSVAYKNLMDNRRSALRILDALDHREKTRQHKEVHRHHHQQLDANHRTQNHTCTTVAIASLRCQVKKELEIICKDILFLLNSYLLPATNTMTSAKADDKSVGEARVFFFKMKGDYHRYYAEVAGDEQKDFARAAYEEAQQCAAMCLPSTHPIRLGLGLNLSVFYYEVMGEHQKGYNTAKVLYEEAAQDLQQLTDDAYREASLIVGLLHDNIALWSSKKS